MKYCPKVSIIGDVAVTETLVITLLPEIVCAAGIYRRSLCEVTEMRKMFHVLENALKEKELLEIYSIQDEGNFDVGVPLKMYKDDFIIQRITKNGNANEYEGIRYEDVIVLKEKTVYLRKLEKLISYKDKDVSLNSQSGIEDVIYLASRNNFNLDSSLYSFEDSIYGRCISYDGAVVCVEECDTKGKPYGKAYVEIEDIRSCCCEYSQNE